MRIRFKDFWAEFEWSTDARQILENELLTNRFVDSTLGEIKLFETKQSAIFFELFSCLIISSLLFGGQICNIKSKRICLCLET
jgi:hypothetical protein